MLNNNLFKMVIALMFIFTLGLLPGCNEDDKNIPLLFFLDTEPPIAVLSDVPLSITNSTSINITVGGDDVIAYEYNLDSAGWSGEIAVDIPITADGLAEGLHTIEVIGRDDSGNWQDILNATTCSWTIDVDLISGNFVINNDDDFSLVNPVTLIINIAGAIEMRFSNDGINFSGWENYAGSKEWTLIAAHGEKTVYGEFRDSVGNVLPVVDVIRYIKGFSGAGKALGYGQSVAVSDDGNTIVIGAYDDEPTENESSAYVYRWDGSSWSETRLMPSDGDIGDYFGYCVSVSGDGNTVAVSSYKDNGGGINSGAVYVYQWDGSAWNEAKLNPSDPWVDDRFGWSVSLSGDGRSLAVGAYGDDDNGNNSGSSYIFVRDFDGTDVWGNGSVDQAAKLTSSDGVEDDNFGWSVSLTDDGKTIVVGSPGDDNDLGSVYVFVRDHDSNDTWGNGSVDQAAKLITTGGVLGDNFGWSVSVSGDGNTIAAGAYGENTNTGSSYIFLKDQDGIDVWGNDSVDQAAKLTSSDGIIGDKFGWSVSVSGDGNTVVIDSYLYPLFSSVYIFNWNSSTQSWVETGLTTFANITHQSSYSSTSIAISNDGNTIVLWGGAETVYAY